MSVAVAACASRRCPAGGVALREHDCWRRPDHYDGCGPYQVEIVRLAREAFPGTDGGDFSPGVKACPDDERHDAVEVGLMAISVTKDVKLSGLPAVRQIEDAGVFSLHIPRRIDIH